MLKDLLSSDKTGNGKTVIHVNNELIDLRNEINRKEIPKNWNPDKVIDITEKILDFNKQ